MRVNYCLPIIQRQPTEILQTIQTNLKDYSYFEVWLDYVDVLHIEDLVAQLNEMLKDRLVLVFRRQNLEPIKMPLENRCRILAQLHESKTLVDLDISQHQAELDYINDLNLRIITSYHNYQQTPDSVQLEVIIAKMEKYKPAIYKLATMCHSQEDGLRLLQLLLKFKQQGRKAIVLGMGVHGVSTRVLGALWGNEMTFAPLTLAHQSAPGQLTKAQLGSIFKELDQ